MNNPIQSAYKQISSNYKPVNKRSGFTLIELMVAMTIIIILSTIGYATFSNAQKFSRDARRKEDLKAIAVALELYYESNRHYPITDSTNGYWKLSTASGTGFWLVDNGNTGGNPAVPVVAFDNSYINELPRDPINNATYNYAYYSSQPGWSMTTGCNPGGVFYILYATLENTNDKDRFGANPFSVCGYTPAQLTWLNNTYVIFGGIRI